jgi:hypothetical protein
LELSQQVQLLRRLLELRLLELRLEPSQQVPKKLQPVQNSLSRRPASLSESEVALWVRRQMEALVLQQP